MFRSPAPPEPLPPTRPGPPTVDEVFNSGSATSAYATSIFREAIEELLEANARFDDVEIRTTSEIERLTGLRADAVTQRRINCKVVEALQALIAEPVEESLPV